MQRLCVGSATVNEIAAPLAMSLNAVSKHLKALEQVGLVRREIKGRVHHIHLNAAPLAEAERWVNQYRMFWESRLDSLDTWLNTSLDDNPEKEEK